MEETQLKELRLKVLGDVSDTSKDELLKIYLKDAKYIALGALYPFDLEITELPARIEENWIVRCAYELSKLAETDGFTAYAENSLSWQRASDYISKDLMLELTPKAGVPK